MPLRLPPRLPLHRGPGGIVLLAVACAVVAGALAALAGLEGGGPLGGVFSGPAVPDLNAPSPRDGQAGRRRRGAAPRSAGAGGSGAGAGRRGPRSRPRGPREGPRAAGRSRPDQGRSPSARGPSPPPRERAPAKGPGAGSPGGAPRPAGGGGGGGAPPRTPLQRLGDTGRGIADTLPEPVRTPVRNGIDGALGPGG